jgi:hypothetical protein
LFRPYPCSSSATFMLFLLCFVYLPSSSLTLSPKPSPVACSSYLLCSHKAFWYFLCSHKAFWYSLCSHKAVWYSLCSHKAFCFCPFVIYVHLIVSLTPGISWLLQNVHPFGWLD